MGQWCGKKRYGDPQWQDYFEEKIETLRNFKICIGHGNYKDVKEFMKRHGISPRSYKGFPPEVLEEIAPVEYACRLGFHSSTGILLDKGFSPKGMSSESPLHIVCAQNSTSAVNMFIERYHVDPNEEDGSHNTPLSVAIKSKSAGVIQYLLEKLGGKIPPKTLKSIDEHGAILIHSAKSDNIKMCQILIDGGFDVNTTDLNGNNALLYAAENFNIDVCTVLLKAGSRIVPHTVNRVCSMFRFRGYWRSEKVKSVIRLLAEWGAELNFQDSRGYTPLHETIGSYYITHFLVCELNVDIGKKNKTGYSPYAVAARQRAPYKVLVILVQAGYNPRSSEYPMTKRWDLPGSYTEEDAKYLSHVVSNSRTLQDLSCFVIRRQLGTNIHDSIKKLHLPNCIEDMILLKELMQSSPY